MLEAVMPVPQESFLPQLSLREEQLVELYYEVRRRHGFVVKRLSKAYGMNADMEDMDDDYKRMNDLRRVMDKLEKRVPYVTQPTITLD